MPKFHRHDLHQLSQSLLQGKGMHTDHARQVAGSLDWADARGVGSHGIAFLPRYLRMIDDTDLRVDAEPEWVGRAPGPLIVEGHQAAGAVVMGFAMDVAMAQAAEHGSVNLWVSHMTHAGAMGQYVQAAAARGYLAMLFVAGPPLMAFHGTIKLAATTGPLAMAVPGPDGKPIVFDMATSAISFARLRRARQLETSLPASVAMDAQGAPTTDPQQAVTPLPMAGAKGSGMAFMFEMMTSVVLGNALVGPKLQGANKGHSQNAWIMVAKVDAFPKGDTFAEEARALIETLKGLPMSEGTEEILLPGERGERSMQLSTATGITLGDSTWEELRSLATALQVALPSGRT